MDTTKKIVFFAFQGEKMCFSHILFNAIDLHEKSINCRIVIEGKATALVKELMQEENPLFAKVLKLNLIDSVCKACANQMGVLEYIEKETDLTLNGDLLGHPPMAPYIEEGFEIITL